VHQHTRRGCWLLACAGRSKATAAAAGRLACCCCGFLQAFSIMPCSSAAAAAGSRCAATARLARCAGHLLPAAAADGRRTKILLVGTMHPAGPEMLRGRDDIELIHIERDAAGELLTTEERVQEMQAQVADADLLVMRVTPLQADTIAMAKRLQAVSWHGVGFDPVDVEALKARGIPLLLPGSANSTAVAEQTMMHMLSVARKTKEYDAAARLGHHTIRDSNSLVSLEGKTVLIVGFGRVGTRVAKRWCGDRAFSLPAGCCLLAPCLLPAACNLQPVACCTARLQPATCCLLRSRPWSARVSQPQPVCVHGCAPACASAAFEMKVVVSDPAIPRRAVEGLGYEYCSDFRERLGDADVVTLHIPAQDDGSAIIGAPEFGLMKKGCILVNCARGTLLDEDALVSALGQGQLAGAGLDVLREEPFDPVRKRLGLFSCLSRACLSKSSGLFIELRNSETSGGFAGPPAVCATADHPCACQPACLAVNGGDVSCDVDADLPGAKHDL
jgi:phosphoglycerate dehydrogenase-like enzyme